MSKPNDAGRQATGVLEPVEMELQLLATLINHPGVFAHVRADMPDGGVLWMSQPHHEAIWQAICRIGDEQGFIDRGTVADRLAQADQLAYVGGHDFLRKVTALDTDEEAVPYLVNRIRGAAYYRELQAALEKAQGMLGEGRDPAELYEHLTSSAQLILGGAKDAAVLWGKDSLVYTERIIEEAMRRHACNAPALSWPWPNWNAFIEPLEPGTVTLIAGLSGLGKTMLAGSLAEHWARLGFKVVFFHYEIGHKNMLLRRLARIAGIEWRRLRWGDLTDDEILKIQRAQAVMDDWKDNIHYVHCPGWSAASVRAKTRQMANLGECDVFIVDYLTKMSLSPQRGITGLNTAQALGNAFNTLKNTAEEDPAIAGVVLSQYNNEAGRVNSVFGLSETMIRNSGEPFQMANLVVYLYGNKLDDDFLNAAGQRMAKKGEFSPVVDCLVAKQTFGELGKTELFFLRRFGRVFPPKKQASP